MASNTVIFDYQGMNTAANTIRQTHAGNYRTAAASFKSAMSAAIAGWTGESKTKFDALLQNTIYPYLDTTVPEIVESVATLLEDNAKTMAQTDKAIADQIPSAG